MAIVQIIIQGKNDSGGAFNSTRKDVDLLDAAVGKLKTGLAALGLSFSAIKLIKLGEDAAMMAARYTTLGVTMDVVGARAGYSAAEMDKLETSLRKNGIAMIESRETLTKMAGAHMDLAKASELSRIAQDAAVIGGTNSSEAYNRMIDGIQRGEVEILKTIGINVNFEQSYKKIAQQLGKTTDELTETEKVQARTNAVMEKGKDIAGAYEAAMGTAGKQLSSMKRYMDNLKVTAGEVFQDLLIVAVGGFTDALKEANTEAEKMQQEGRMQQWGRDVVITMSGVADAVRIVINVIATATGAAIAGMMQVYKLGEAARELVRGDFSGAKRHLEEIATIGNAWWDDMQKRWKGKSFTASAEEMFAARDANKGADAEKKKALEERLLAEGKARREEEEARAKAEVEEKRYLENVKNSIAGVKEYSSATKDLGKERLQAANEKYSERLRDEIDLYKEVARAADDLVKPLRRYNVEANDIFNERLSHEKSALDRLGAMSEEFKKKIAINAQAKEAKAAGVDILKAYKDTAVGVISVEQDRYKTLMEGERQYANAVMALIKEKKKEIAALKQSIADANAAFEEQKRASLQGSYVNGQYRYLDTSLDPFDKRSAQIDELRRKEAEYAAIADPAERQKKTLSLISEWEKLGEAVEIVTKKTKSYADFQAFSIDGYIPYKTEIVESIDTIITKEEALNQVAQERKRIQDTVMQGATEELQSLENAHQSSLEKMENYKSKLLELDGVLASLTRTITIDLQVNGMEAIQQIQGFVGSAVVSPFSGSSSVDFGTGWGAWSDGSSADELPQYATGTPYVPRTGPAILHQGEAVIPAVQNKGGFGSVSIGSISITMQSSGDAQTDADQLARNLVPSIRKRMGRSFAA